MQLICQSASLLGINNICPEMFDNALKPAFVNHMNKFGLSYGTQEEFDFRFQLFQEKDAEIARVNSDPEHTFTVGHNKFSTWTSTEYKRLLSVQVPAMEAEEVVLPEIGNPEAVDWRTKKAVGPVKNQGQCGSCWAFAATASTEALYAIKKKELLDLSEQQLVDCVTSSSGCNGGSLSSPFQYL